MLRDAPPLRVLLVDDWPDTTASFAFLLRGWGYEAFEAHDGPAALRAAEAARPDVVLLDLGLPGMDGYEVARRLRRLPHLGRVLLVAVTGHGRGEDRRRAREAGFDFFLFKPCDPDSLRGLLAAYPRCSGARGA